ALSLSLSPPPPPLLDPPLLPSPVFSVFSGCGRGLGQEGLEGFEFQPGIGEGGEVVLAAVHVADAEDGGVADVRAQVRARRVPGEVVGEDDVAGPAGAGVVGNAHVLPVPVRN